MKHFFISYNSADRTWAEWIAWQLEEAGYTTVLQVWDFRPGSNFVLEMQKAATEAERTIAVLSPDYLSARFTQPEWAAAFVQDATGEKGTLLPVRVRECDLKGLLAQIVYVDLVGLDEVAAKDALLAGVRRERAKPVAPPTFPGAVPRSVHEEPRFPGALASIEKANRKSTDLSLLEELLDELSVIRTLHFHHPDFQSWHNTVKLSLRQIFGEDSYHITEYDKIIWHTSDKPEDADEQHNLYLRSCATAKGLLKAAIRTFTVPPSEATATPEGTQMPKSPPTVFISYAREDLEDALKLYNDLKRAGAKPWLDKESLLPGQRWKVEIRRAIRENRYFLAVLSSNSVSRRGYVHKEVAEALELLGEFPESEIFIIPARLDNCSPSHESLRDLHWVDMFPKWEDGLKKILLAIQVIPEDETVHPDVLERVKPFEPEMVLIPAGEFLMGSDPSVDKDAFDDEQPQHTLHLPNYYLAKTPVTNAQYAAFVQATGHRSPHYGAVHTKPYDWHGQTPPRGRENHPVVLVSWYDAVEYCNWLAEVTGKPYRLPSEAEWEKGARGSDGRIYPWGNQWDARRLNTRAGGKDDTTPVGAYPKGASPYGLLDMAGNVWEWTRSVYKDYPYRPEDGRENPDAPQVMHRALRGGGFDDIMRHARCAYRSKHGSELISQYTGFRVAMSP